MKTSKKGSEYGMTILYLSPILGLMYMVVQFYIWTS